MTNKQHSVPANPIIKVLSSQYTLIVFDRKIKTMALCEHIGSATIHEVSKGQVKQLLKSERLETLERIGPATRYGTNSSRTKFSRVAGLKGRNLSLIEHRVLRQLKGAKIDLGGLPLAERRSFPLEEELAMTLGLLFRALAPMRSRDNMRMVAEGIEAMGLEEAAYWLGMAMHRKNPRRVLMAPRFLLIDPKQKN